MNNIDHDGDHVSYDDAVLSAVNISSARERARLKREERSPHGTCGECEVALLPEEASSAWPDHCTRHRTPENRWRGQEEFAPGV